MPSYSDCIQPHKSCYKKVAIVRIKNKDRGVFGFFQTFKFQTNLRGRPERRIRPRSESSPGRTGIPLVCYAHLCRTLWVCEADCSSQNATAANHRALSWSCDSLNDCFYVSYFCHFFSKKKIKTTIRLSPLQGQSWFSPGSHLGFSPLCSCDTETQKMSELWVWGVLWCFFCFVMSS